MAAPTFDFNVFGEASWAFKGFNSYADVRVIAPAAIDDLIIFVLWSPRTSSVPTHTLNAGYTPIFSVMMNGDGNDGRLSAAYRVQTVTDAEHTPWSQAADEFDIATAWVVDAGTYSLASIQSATLGFPDTSIVPNPPSLAGLTGDWAFFAIGAWHDTGVGSTVTAPTDYTEGVEHDNAGANPHDLSVAYRTRTGLSDVTEDPDGFVDNVTSEGWCAALIAISDANPAMRYRVINSYSIRCRCSSMIGFNK